MSARTRLRMAWAALRGRAMVLAGEMPGGSTVQPIASANLESPTISPPRDKVAELAIAATRARWALECENELEKTIRTATDKAVACAAFMKLHDLRAPFGGGEFAILRASEAAHWRASDALLARDAAAAQDGA